VDEFLALAASKYTIKSYLGPAPEFDVKTAYGPFACEYWGKVVSDLGLRGEVGRGWNACSRLSSLILTLRTTTAPFRQLPYSGCRTPTSACTPTSSEEEAE
jgi:hypothetical protein